MAGLHAIECNKNDIVVRIAGRARFFMRGSREKNKGKTCRNKNYHCNGGGRRKEFHNKNKLHGLRNRRRKQEKFNIGIYSGFKPPDAAESTNKIIKKALKELK
jgi:hypothetical protein